MSAIAIIGMDCIFPGAPDAATFWQNISNGVDAISDAPEGRIDPRFFDEKSSAVDRFYCRKGGFVDTFTQFDPLAFGVMPKVAEVVEPDQLLTLKVGHGALKDAGYLDQPFPREKTGVIIGRGNYVSAGVLRLEQHVRTVPQIMQTLRDLFPELDEHTLQAAEHKLKAELPYYGPDAASGLIPNLIASRLANRLDLGGVAYTIDAACASALLAVEQACRLLDQGGADMMLVGGVHLTHDLTFWATFCQLGALSRSGVISPLSDKADGILAGEGVGMVVLKRLDDAMRDEDRIYAVIEGAGSASDGRSASVIAPSASGQMQAIQRAWAGLKHSPDDLDLLEAHGTGTPTGDSVELETVGRFFGKAIEDNPASRAVIGSVKSMIGHAMPASGMASLIKTSLAIYHGVLPPTLHCERPNPKLQETRFKTLNKAEPWPKPVEKRLAGVNAFGFGGINAHVVLRGVEQHQSAPIAVAPVLRLAADNPEDLLAQLDLVIQGEMPSNRLLGACRLAIVDPDEKRLTSARKIVSSGKPWAGRQQIWFSPKGLLGSGGKLAIVFPGVDSAFQPQVDDLARYFKRPVPMHCKAADPAENLPKVVVGLLGLNRLLFDILKEQGLQVDGFAGHSVGEWSAMLASGMMDQSLSDQTNATLDLDAVEFPDVQFLAAGCSLVELEQAMTGLSNLALSHDNCPHQVIACGYRNAIEALGERLRSQGVFCQTLPFVSGFHSPLFADHMAWYQQFFGEADLLEPGLPVWSATTMQPYPAAQADKKELALRHLLEPVRFRGLIRNMYDAGYRVFVQAGTGSLPGFIDDTLKGLPHLALHTNTENRSGLAQLQAVLAALWVEGAEPHSELLEHQTTVRSDTNGIALKLSVPLLRIAQGLDSPVLKASSATPKALPVPDSADPLGQLLRQTLLDIEQASRDVLELWQEHRLKPQRALTAQQHQVVLESTATRLLDLDSTIPWVHDHALYPQREGWTEQADRHPVVPLTMEVMLIVDWVESQLHGQGLNWRVQSVHSIEAYNWLIVTHPVSIEMTLEQLDPQTWQAEIKGYFRARVKIGPEQQPESEQEKTHSFEALNKPRSTAVSADALYREGWMFHGPAYQGVRAMTAIGDNGIDGVLTVPEGQGALLDNMGQLAGYWVMEQPENCLAMPIGVGTIEFFGPQPALHEQLQAKVRISHLDALNCVSNHELRDESGALRIRISGWRTRRYQMDKALWEASRDLGHHTVSKRVPPNVALFDDRYDTAIMRDYLSRRYLCQSERDVYENLPPKRRRDWLSGRIAAKDAVRGHLFDQGALPVYPQEMRIVNDTEGAPYVLPNVTRQVSPQLNVSITHKDNIAAAIVGTSPVGIDIERIEQRDASFAELVFTPEELRTLQWPDENPAVALTRGWVAKEVMAKMQRKGLGSNLHTWTIEQRDSDCLCIAGQWVVTHVLGQHVIGWTLTADNHSTTTHRHGHIEHEQ